MPLTKWQLEMSQSTELMIIDNPVGSGYSHLARSLANLARLPGKLEVVATVPLWWYSKVLKHIKTHLKPNRLNRHSERPQAMWLPQLPDCLFSSHTKFFPETGHDGHDACRGWNEVTLGRSPSLSEVEFNLFNVFESHRDAKNRTQHRRLALSGI